jgi:hypothetical protein
MAVHVLVAIHLRDAGRVYKVVERGRPGRLAGLELIGTRQWRGSIEAFLHLERGLQLRYCMVLERHFARDLRVMRLACGSLQCGVCRNIGE